jgi:hypothetical protein
MRFADAAIARWTLSDLFEAAESLSVLAAAAAAL